MEYREKMLLKGWEYVKCSEEMHTLYPDSYREVCVEDEHNWTPVVAYWKTPEGLEVCESRSTTTDFRIHLAGEARYWVVCPTEH